MKRIGYFKPKTFIVLEAFAIITRPMLLKSFYPFVSFCQLQGISRYILIGWILPTPLLGLFPFSAIIVKCDKQDSNSAAILSAGFAKPLDRPFISTTCEFIPPR